MLGANISGLSLFLNVSRNSFPPLPTKLYKQVQFASYLILILAMFAQAQVGPLLCLLTDLKKKKFLFRTANKRLPFEVIHLQSSSYCPAHSNLKFRQCKYHTTVLPLRINTGFGNVCGEIAMCENAIL